MADLDLDELDRLCAAATPGPWDEGMFGCGCCSDLRGDDFTLAAAACTAMPALIAEVRRLRALCKSLDELTDELVETQAEDQRDAILVGHERERAAIVAWLRSGERDCGHGCGGWYADLIEANDHKEAT